MANAVRKQHRAGQEEIADEGAPDITVYRLRIPTQFGDTVVFDSIQDLLDDVRIWLEETGPPLEIAICSGTMTRAEKDALPEFEGY